MFYNGNSFKSDFEILFGISFHNVVFVIFDSHRKLTFRDVKIVNTSSATNLTLSDVIN